MQIIMIN